MCIWNPILQGLFYAQIIKIDLIGMNKVKHERIYASFHGKPQPNKLEC